MKIFDQVCDSHELSAVVVRNGDAEILLKRHNDLNGFKLVHA